jgi:CheY-like chemotaxis protein
VLAQKDRVVVIDDDDDGRDTLIDSLGDHHYEGVSIVGRYGNDIDRLLHEIEASNPRFVICDHRLTAKQYATFNGLQVVERLIELKRPAMLLTTYQEPERIALREARWRVPVIKGRDRFSVDEVPALFDIVRSEIAEEPVASRKPHRVLLRVEAVRDADIDVVVPSWNRDHAFVLTKRSLGDKVRGVVKGGDYLLGDVNIGATAEDELYFAKVDEIVDGIEEEL